VSTDDGDVGLGGGGTGEGREEGGGTDDVEGRDSEEAERGEREIGISLACSTAPLEVEALTA
jgi:hypothetical protein